MTELTQREQAVLNEAVKVLYLDDSSDYVISLYKIVAILAGDEATSLLVHDSEAAYKKYCKPDEATTEEIEHWIQAGANS
jgi:hypothetical protein